MGSNIQENNHEHNHAHSNHKHSDEDYKKLINRMSRIIGHANTNISSKSCIKQFREENIRRSYKQMYSRCSGRRTVRRKTKIIKRFK